MQSRVLALLNCHNSPELGDLTATRPLASTSFLGRYALMDFAMSNFTNSGFQNISVLVKNHQRSILKHMGNMMFWVNNTKIGRVGTLTNEDGILNPAYNTDINNIKENDYLLYESDIDTLLFAAPEIIASVDFRPYIEEHFKRGEQITMIYKDIEDADEQFIGGHVLEVGEDGYLLDAERNNGEKKKAKASLEMWIINREILREMIQRQKRVDASWGIAQMIVHFAKHGLAKVHCVPFDGYVRRFDSLKHYCEYSFELLEHANSKALFKHDWPIWTRTHDTPPAIYGENSKVNNSFISNGCIIDGEVKDSIICRGVKVAKGAKIEKSIVLSMSQIGEKARLKDVVMDKYCIMSEKHHIEGDEENIIYLKQGITV